MTSLQDMAQRQEEEIRVLQKATAEIRMTIAPTGNSSKLEARDSEMKHEDSVPRPVEAQAAQTESPAKEKIPLWKDNLNNILSMLDKIENEVKK